MFENENNKSFIILKRNDEEEKKLNYTKIYDLSQIDALPFINQEKKYSLLITIKKVLLCTNKYIDICNTKEIINYFLMSLLIYVFYVVFFSPSIKIYFLTEEQCNDLQYLTITKKFWYYSITQFIEIIFRLFFNYSRKKKVKNIILYYTRNELKKIQDDFIIDIDENSYDLTIYLGKNKFNKYNKEEKEKTNFYQYVICYPNVRYYDWDKKILNEKEKTICNIIKNSLQNIEDNYLLKFSFTAIIIFVIYIFAFYFLTVGHIIIFFILMLILFFFTKIISLIISNYIRETLILSEELNSKIYIKQGYLLHYSTKVILIFRLNSEYEKCDVNDLNEIYKKLYKEINIINEKYNTIKLF